MSNLAPEPGRRFRNMLSRTPSQEQPKTPPATSLQGSQDEQPSTTCKFAQYPSKVHPGEYALEESDFQASQNSVLFGPWKHGRVYCPIRRRRLPEINEKSYRRAADCLPTRQREERQHAIRADPYHQFVYSTKGNGSPVPSKSTGTGSALTVDRGTQTLPPICTPNLAEKAKLEPTTECLVLPSSTDPLDCPALTFDPPNASSQHPVRILSSPNNMNDIFESADPSHPSYEIDREERFLDPVPGAAVYVGELIDRTRKLSPQDWNVVYISLDWVSGKVVVRAPPFNRSGMRVGLHDRFTGERELKRADIELRRGFGEGWVLSMEEETLQEIKTICKERLVKEAGLYHERELKFEEDVGNLWKERRG